LNEKSKQYTAVCRRGITFRGAAKTFLGPHISTTNGADWAVPRSAALELSGVSGALIDDCKFDNLGGSAVLWSGAGNAFCAEKSSTYQDRLGTNVQ